jgi:hypothetical protein
MRREAWSRALSFPLHNLLNYGEIVALIPSYKLLDRGKILNIPNYLFLQGLFVLTALAHDLSDKKCAAQNI